MPFTLQIVLGIIINSTHQEKVLNAINYSVDAEDRLPILPQDVEAHVALKVNVGMKYALLAFHLGRFVGVFLADFEAEGKPAALIKAFVRTDINLEIEEVVRIWMVEDNGLWKGEFDYICKL